SVGHRRACAWDDEGRRDARLGPIAGQPSSYRHEQNPVPWRGFCVPEDRSASGNLLRRLPVGTRIVSVLDARDVISSGKYLAAFFIGNGNIGHQARDQGSLPDFFLGRKWISDLFGALEECVH